MNLERVGTLVAILIAVGGLLWSMAEWRTQTTALEARMDTALATLEKSTDLADSQARESVVNVENEMRSTIRAYVEILNERLDRRETRNDVTKQEMIHLIIDGRERISRIEGEIENGTCKCSE